MYELTVSEQLSCQFVELLEPVNIYFRKFFLQLTSIKRELIEYLKSF